jgi:hypothetical protein
MLAGTKTLKIRIIYARGRGGRRANAKSVYHVIGAALFPFAPSLKLFTGATGPLPEIIADENSRDLSC